MGKFFLSSLNTYNPIPNWNPRALQPSRQATCKHCQLSGLFWGWSFSHKRSMIVDAYGHQHVCPTPAEHDVFPGWCDQCTATDLVWLRTKNGIELHEGYGLPHTCEQTNTIHDMSVTSCRYCKTKDLLWVQRFGAYSIVNHSGVKHKCKEFSEYMDAWAEAKRMNYALEKTWLKSIPDDHECKKCKGLGYTTFTSKNKRLMYQFNSTEPIIINRWCKKCKHIGTFSAKKKKQYLADMRKRYWPFHPTRHKWKKYNP